MYVEVKELGNYGTWDEESKHCSDGRHKWMPKGIFKCTEVYNGECTPDSKLRRSGV